MREVLSLATFVLGVLCFVAFVTAVKPNAFATAEAPNKPAHCQTDDSQKRFAPLCRSIRLRAAVVTGGRGSTATDKVAF
jgi:hypothetical protein